MEKESRSTGAYRANQAIRKARDENNKILDLGDFGLREFPLDLFELYELQALSLGTYYFYPEKFAHPGVTTTSREKNNNTFSSYELGKLSKLPNLRHLHLNNISLENLDFLDSLPRIEYLSLTGISFKCEPLSRLNNLKYLILSNSQLIETDFFRGLGRLEMLRLERCSFDNVNFLSYLKNLTSLSITEPRYFDGFSSSLFFQLSNYQLNLEVLSLIDCSIQQISSLVGLDKLRHIDFSFNGIRNMQENAFPSTIQTLNLQNNSLQNIYAMSSWPHLTTLNISHNPIADIQALDRNRSLVDLNISSCSIKDIGFASTLTNLRKLDFSDNKVDSISPLLHLSSLEELTFLNSVNYVELSDLKMLINKNTLAKKILFNTDNLPHSVTQDLAALKEYLRKADENGLSVNRSIKVIVVGNTRAGKTQLLNYLIDRRYESDSNSTHGLQLREWSPTINGHSYKIQFVDFGGQEYYHSTHNLYLDPNAVYVVVWDNNDNNDKNDNDYFSNFSIDYWLGNIASLVGRGHVGLNKIPVIVVQSKSDIEGSEHRYVKSETFDLYGLESFGQFFLSAKNASEINDDSSPWHLEWQHFEAQFKLNLSAVSRHLPKLTSEMLHVQNNVIPKLQSNDLLILPVSVFLRESDENYSDGNPNKYLDTLLYLHGAGEILWYREHQSLKDYVVVNPSSWSKLVFEVLAFAYQNAEFNDDQVSDILARWNTEMSTDTIAFYLIMLLKKYHIVFEKPGFFNSYIVPHYLGREKLEPYLQNLVDLRVSVRFNAYMPHWRMSKFISLKAKRSALHYWRNGIIYKDDEDTIVMVRVENKKSEQKLYIHIGGSPRKKIDVSKEILEFFAATEAYAIYKLSLEEKRLILSSEEKTTINDSTIEFIKLVDMSVDDIHYFPLDEIASLRNVTGNNRYIKSTDGVIQLCPSTLTSILGVSNTTPKKIFFSYSHADALLRKQFEKHLAALKRSGVVETWYDMEIQPGDIWDKKIMNELEQADFVLGLVSPDFMDSSYIWSREIPRIRGRFIPIYLRPCDFDGTIISSMKGLPSHFPGESIDRLEPGIKWVLHKRWFSVDEAMLSVIEGLKVLLGD